MSDTSVKFFNSAMPGAPVCSGSPGSLLAVLDACLVDGFGLQAAVSATLAAGVCTLTLSATPAAQVGSVVLVSGATPASLNGEHRVTAITASSLSFASAEPDGPVTGTLSVKLAPAGWLKAYAATNQAAYQIDAALHPDTTGCLLRLDDSGGTSAIIRGYESMSDISTGLGAFPSVGQQTNLYVCKSDTASTSPRPWLVVCDSRMVYVGVRFYSTNDTNYGPAWWCFGEFASKKPADPYRFMLCGNYPVAGVPAPTDSMQICATNVNYAYAARSYTALGGSVKLGVWTWPNTYGVSGAGSLPYPNGPDYALYLCPADLVETNPTHLRGRLPGLLMIPHSLTRKICPDAKTAYLDDNVPGFAGRTIGFMPCAYSGAEWTVVAFDLTGPWAY